MDGWMDRYFGILEDISSDRGAQFMSQVWSSFMEKLKVTVSHLRIPPSVQWSSGMGQWANPTSRFQNTFCATDQEDWCQFFPWAEYTQNTLTPFQCVLGYQLPAVDEWFQKSVQFWKKTLHILQQAAKTYKDFAD